MAPDGGVPAASTAAAATTGASTLGATSPTARTSESAQHVAGCPAGGGGLPVGAATRSIIDIDGDGRRDTGWAISSGSGSSTWRYGFTTASGTTSSVTYSTAGGSSPRILFADVDGAGTIAALIAYSRAAALYVVSRCKLVPVTNPEGQTYTFDTGFRGTGTGVGCYRLAGAASQTLVGLNALANAQGTNARITRTQVLITGTQARNGLTDVITSPDQAAERSARRVSCGDLTAELDGVVPPPAAK